MDGVYETISDAVVCIDENGTITQVNTATERMFLYERDELIGSHVRVLFSGRGSELLASEWNKKLQQLLGKIRILDGKRQNGECFQLEISVGESSSSCSSSPMSSSWASFDDEFPSPSAFYVATIRDLTHRTSESRYEKDFEELELLGRGGFGTVYKVRNLLDDSLYAIKKIKIKAHSVEAIANHKFLREVKAMARLASHVNVIRYYQSWLERPQLRTRSLSNSSLPTKGDLRGPLGMSYPQLISPSFGESPSDPSLFLSPSASPIRKSPLSDDYKKSTSSVNVPSSLPSSLARRLDFDNHQPSQKKNLASSFSRYQSESLSESDSLSNTKTESDDEDEEDEDEEESEDSSSQNDFHGGGNSLFKDTHQSGRSNLAKSWHHSRPTPLEIPKQTFTSKNHYPSFDQNKKKKEVQMILYIQMELCSSETLKQWLEKREKISLETNMNFFKQIISGLAHIHSQSFIHRDIKPANIFIDQTTVRIGDFGLVRNVHSSISRSNSSSQLSDNPNELSCGIGTNTYAAPEQLDGKNYDEKVDIYASGIVLLEMFSQWGTVMEKAIVVNELKHHRKVPISFSMTCKEEAALVLELTHPDPSKRPSSAQLVARFSQTPPLSSSPPSKGMSCDTQCPCCSKHREEIALLKKQLQEKESELNRLQKAQPSRFPFKK